MPHRLLIVAVMAILLGCSGAKPRVPVYGRVTVRGCAVRGGAMAFTPDRERGYHGDTRRVELSSDGCFRVPDGGLPPGWYRLTIASLEVPLATRYRDPDLAGLAREVVAGRENSWDIELD